MSTEAQIAVKTPPASRDQPGCGRDVHAWRLGKLYRDSFLLRQFLDQPVEARLLRHTE